MSAFAALILVAAAATSADCRLELPRDVAQGALVFGTVAPGCRLAVDGRAVRVAADGRFVFGLGRDAPAEARVVATDGTGKRHETVLPVKPRPWRIERVDGVPQGTVTPSPELAARIAREQARVAAARQRDDDRQDFRFGFDWPLRGRISGVYGSQRVLNGTPKDPHYGLDIAAPTGTPVRAPAPGLVSFAADDLYLTGGTLLIDHGHGLSSVFLHLSRIDVREGERVEAGQVIAAVGATGRASGPHLHWGMNWFDVRVDPQPLLPP